MFSLADFSAETSSIHRDGCSKSRLSVLDFRRLPCPISWCFRVAGEWYAEDTRTVTIVGLRAEGNGEQSNCNSHDLSILLRLQGPEALAEVRLPSKAGKAGKVSRGSSWARYSSVP